MTRKEIDPLANLFNQAFSCSDGVTFELSEEFAERTARIASEDMRSRRPQAQQNRFTERLMMRISFACAAIATILVLPNLKLLSDQEWFYAYYSDHSEIIESADLASEGELYDEQ